VAVRLFVPLTKMEFDALRELARAERRRPQDQAAVLTAWTLADTPGTAAHSDELLSEPAERERNEVECVSA
jgi:hypothetical protein